MHACGMIAIYNATHKELEQVESNWQVENYWRLLDEHDRVYLLEDYAFVDEELLAEYEHEQFIDDGWTVLQ